MTDRQAGNAESPSQSDVMRGAAIEARARQAEYVAEIGSAVTEADDAEEMLHRCAEAMVVRLGAAFGRIWTVDAAGTQLTLRASAGLYTHLDGPHGSIPVGSFKIGRIASERRAHLTNDVVADSHVSDPDWARREGMVAFAGHPLLVGGRLVGVMAMFSREALDDDTLIALAAGARLVGLGIERHRAAEALRYSEAFTRSVVHVSLDAVISMDAGGEICEWNRAAEGIFGWSANDAIGRELAEVIVPPRYREAHRAGLHRFLTTGEAPVLDQRIELEAVHQDGYEFPVELTISHAVTEKGVVFHGFVRDISVRKQLQAEIEATADRLHRAQAAAKIGTWDWSVDTNALVWDGVEAVHGVTPGTFGGSFDAYIADMHPDDQERVTAAISLAASTATEVDVQYRIVTPDGTIRWVAGKGSPILDEDGVVCRMIGTCQDITKEKLAEEALQESFAQLEAANRSKDEFIGLVSHELKSPITTILGNAAVLRKRFDELDAETKVAAFEDIESEAERLHRIIDDMLILARLETAAALEREPLRLGVLVRTAIADHVKRFPHRSLELDVAPDVPIVAAHGRYIDQVLRNLISNAEKYSPPEEPIDIVVGLGDGQAYVSVRDRGPGVAADQLTEIFAPFYRAPETATKAQGIGIGLSVCRRLIESEGGQISASIREGGGLDVTFTLPAAPGDEVS